MLFGGKKESEIDYTSLREQMVDRQLAGRGVKDKCVLSAMRSVPRHLFVPDNYCGEAYDDNPLPIGHEQTISQPFIVASMTEHLDIDHDSKVLEIGTGCGYQTAVLAEIAREVCTIEIIPSLLDNARENFKTLCYRNIKTRLGDGSCGWPEEAPFDGIIVTAAAPRVPEALLEQLEENGVMVIPLGSGMGYSQDLVKVRRTSQGPVQEFLYHVRFVPMRGEVEGGG